MIALAIFASVFLAMNRLISEPALGSFDDPNVAFGNILTNGESRRGSLENRFLFVAPNKEHKSSVMQNRGEVGRIGCANFNCQNILAFKSDARGIVCCYIRNDRLPVLICGKDCGTAGVHGAPFGIRIAFAEITDTFAHIRHSDHVRWNGNGSASDPHVSGRTSSLRPK
jgi:hypothetical protein